jgi:hypothetical protein
MRFPLCERGRDVLQKIGKAFKLAHLGNGRLTYFSGYRVLKGRHAKRLP